MRHPPACVGGIPVEPAPEVIADPAVPHRIQGLYRHVEGPSRPGPLRVPQEKKQHMGCREFRGLPEPPITGIEPQDQFFVPVIEERGIRIASLWTLRLFPERTDDLLRGPEEFFPLIAPGAGNAGQELEQAVHGKPPLFREVRGGEERLPVRAHDDRERPAPLAGDHLADLHIHRVDIRPLLAVHLDADKCLIEQCGNFLVLERFVRHHVAPVTGRIPDGEKDRLVLPGSAGKGLLPPRVPVDRVMGVLEEIGAFLVNQPVRWPAGPVATGGFLRWGRFHSGT
eukprot:TRINITY_DN19079_c0_g1_i1.p2 TRINITY_DN19079_c0_g1~~TRINITY_DN19079_c0_g1_i1.p2  ORF type:complete len:283 (+),score=-24.92 TRINITY_DN19079_c0_g1_i1:540-1388(+)